MTFPVSDILEPLHLVSHFEVGLVLQQARRVQNDAGMQGKVRKHTRQLPNSWQELSDTDKDWLQELLCTATRTTFVETGFVWVDRKRKADRQIDYPF